LSQTETKLPFLGVVLKSTSNTVLGVLHLDLSTTESDSGARELDLRVVSDGVKLILLRLLPARPCAGIVDYVRIRELFWGTAS